MSCLSSTALCPVTEARGDAEPPSYGAPAFPGSQGPVPAPQLDCSASPRLSGRPAQFRTSLWNVRLLPFPQDGDREESRATSRCALRDLARSIEGETGVCTALARTSVTAARE